MYLKTYAKGSKLWQLLACSVIAFLKYIQVSENSMTGRAYIGEVLTQVWLKSIKKASELFDKEANAQKESLKVTSAPANLRESVRLK